MSTRRRTAASDAAVVLLFVAIVWGSMFPMSGSLLRHLAPDDYVAERAFVASVALFTIRPGLRHQLDRRLVRSGILLGTIYCLGQILQFEGLSRASATSTAFTISLFVVFVPGLLAVLARTLPDGLTLAGAGLAGTGVIVMLFGGAFGPGAIFDLLAMFTYTVYIVTLGYRARTGGAIALSFVQMVTMAVVSSLIASLNGMTLPTRPVDWLALFYLAVAAGAGAMVAQVWAQARLSATQTSILMVTEPVWAALFAVAFYGERDTARTYVGAALILIATLAVLLRPRPREILDEDLTEQESLGAA